MSTHLTLRLDNNSVRQYVYRSHDLLAPTRFNGICMRGSERTLTYYFEASIGSNKSSVVTPCDASWPFEQDCLYCFLLPSLVMRFQYSVVKLDSPVERLGIVRASFVVFLMST